MTDEQKQRRAENARANGRKSKGPVTPAGKYRSSMNAISTGEHTELHQEDLPSFFPSLSNDNRASYIRSFQDHLRRFQPACEYERSLVRRMTTELYLFDRQTELATQAAQEQIDWVLANDPESEAPEQFLRGHQRVCKQRDLLRMIDRNKRTHLSAYQNFMKLFVQSRNQLGAKPEPLPEVVAEILAVADQAKKEPSFTPPLYVVNFLKDKDFMQQMAPGYEVADLLKRFARIPPDTAFHMKNESATRKPRSLRSVTL